MSLRLSKKTVIVGRHESTYGTPPTFDYSTDAFEIISGELTFPMDRIERDTLKQTIGASAGVVAGVHVQLTFTVEMKGSGWDSVNNKPNEPRIGRLIESCLFEKSQNWDGATTWSADTAYSAGDKVIPSTENGFVYVCTTGGTSGSSEPSWPTEEGQTVTDGTVEWTAYRYAYEYTPSSGILGVDVPSIAFEVYYAGSGTQADKYVLVGCGGTFRFTGTVGQFPTIEFTFTGKLYSDPVAANIPSVTYDSTLPEPFQGATFKFDDQTNFCINTLDIDCGNTVALRRCVSEADGIAGVLITERSVTGTIDPEAVLQSDYDMFAKFKSGETVTMEIGYVGDTQGNMFKIVGNYVQVTDFRYGDRDGIAIWNLPILFAEGPAGQSEIVIRFA